MTGPVLSADQWSELHDFLMLALDAIGIKPVDFNADYLRNCVGNRRRALKITHKAFASLGGEACPDRC